jgi:DNA modification methylase
MTKANGSNGKAGASVKVLDEASGEGWALYHGDSCEVLRGLPADSVGLSIYSPPFASLYTYSNSDRDLGNCKDAAEFFAHFSWLMPEMFRVTMPGRNMCVHCMDLPTSKVRDGRIGLRDFPGDIIRAAEAAGWVWHSKITIWKDPVTAVQRTKAKGLLFKQTQKDSAAVRMGIPDYVLTFQKPGDNPFPVIHEYFGIDEMAVRQMATAKAQETEKWRSIEVWQKWASPVWFDIDPGDTLQYRRAREDADERHICPLQLEVIRRCMVLWSNPGDVVLSPFAGIGSEGYVSVENHRKYVGCELKRSYYEQAVKNLQSAEPKAKGSQLGLFDDLPTDPPQAAAQ